MISTIKDLRIDELIDKIDEIVTSGYREYKIIIPYNRTSLLDEIYKNTLVLNQTNKLKHMILKVQCSRSFYTKIKQKLVA